MLDRARPLFSMRALNQACFVVDVAAALFAQLAERDELTTPSPQKSDSRRAKA